MIQNLITKLDNLIYFFGFAPDLKLRIAFGSVILESIVVAGLFLYLTSLILMKKNQNFLKKEVLYISEQNS